MRRIKKWLALGIVASSVLGTVGCRSTESVNDIVSLPRTGFITKDKMLDEGAEGLKYVNISVRTAVKEEDIGYNTIDSSSAIWKKLVSAYQEIMAEHNKILAYKITPGLHDYFKVFADDMVLSNSTVKRAREAGGYYYMTVEYNVNDNKLGTFTDRANYLGIDGIIIKDYFGNDAIDELYLKTLLGTINAYRKVLGKPELVNYENPTGFVAPPAPVETEPTNEGAEAGENTENNTPETEAPEIDTPEVNTPVDIETPQVSNTNTIGQEPSGVHGYRRFEYDQQEITSLVGSSKEQIAYMPEVTMVFNPANTEGELNGFGFYRNGALGLQNYGYKKSYNGVKLTVTYVFKQNEYKPEEMSYAFMFINSIHNNENKFNDESYATKKEEVPTFIEDCIETAIERLDRAINNGDVATLTNGSLLDDVGLGMRFATYRETTDINHFKSSLKRVIARDYNIYLVEVERTIEEAPKNTGAIAQYKDIVYMVVRQDGTEFKINDFALAQRELTKQPIVDPEDVVTRRLIALNLYEPVSETTKVDITNSLINQLMDYTTNRTLFDNGDIAFYSLFNSDRDLLPNERYTYLRSQIVSRLTLKGGDTKSTVKIIPTEWIGGYDAQVEFKTKELVTYEGWNCGMYTENSYFVSHYGTSWVIDEIISIKEEFLEGDEFNSTASQFN